MKITTSNQAVLKYDQTDENQKQIQFLWNTLKYYPQGGEHLQFAEIDQIECLLTRIAKLHHFIELNLIKGKLDILIQILTINNCKVRSKSLILLSQILQNMPNFAIYYFLQHSCFWALIHRGCIVKEQIQGYCKLIINLFQHRHAITNQTNLSKIIELIPNFCQYVKSSLVTQLCARLIAAIQSFNQDKNGLCFRIYSYFTDNKPQALALIYQLQLNYRLNTSKLFNRSEQIIQMILQNLQPSQSSDSSSLEILFLLLRREQISQYLRETIIQNFVKNFEKKDFKMKSIILRIFYALYQSQFSNWYFSRKQTRKIIQHVLDLSLSAINSQENCLAEMAVNKLHRYLNGDDFSQEQRLRGIFFNVVSHPQHLNKFRQIQRKLDPQLSQAVKILIETIKQGYSDTSYTEQSLSLRNYLNQEINIDQSEQMLQENQPFHVYQCSDSQF